MNAGKSGPIMIVLESCLEQYGRATFSCLSVCGNSKRPGRAEKGLQSAPT